MKPFFTYEEQIERLKQNGLTISDEDNAINVLRTEGYYNVINGYSPIFKNEKGIYYKKITFDNIKDVYDFDKSLRIIVYKHTSSIETHLKALIAHEFSRVNGVDEKEYLKPTCFTSSKKAIKEVNRLIIECNQTIKDALNKQSNKYREYIAHNYNEHTHVPMWVLIRALSFGTVSIFYKNMKTGEKNAVASNYKISADQLENMLELVVAFRNIVAHGERTYCARLRRTRLSTQLSITKKLCIAKNVKGEIKFGRNDFLALLISCKYLLNASEFDEMIAELTRLLDDLDKKINPLMMGKIKTLMGLKSNSWKNLPKLLIEDKTGSE